MKLSVGVLIYETEGGSLLVQGQLGLQGKTLTQSKQTNKILFSNEKK